mmetsp:Transcript_19972/g.57233  ORF Transcript_19972/g.57233 Transcript_19972/m.57233 type:complete len:237 (-) Transcript_19972:297-1007(-)
MGEGVGERVLPAVIGVDDVGGRHDGHHLVAVDAPLLDLGVGKGRPPLDRPPRGCIEVEGRRGAPLPRHTAGLPLLAPIPLAAPITVTAVAVTAVPIDHRRIHRLHLLVLALVLHCRAVRRDLGREFGHQPGGRHRRNEPVGQPDGRLDWAGGGAAGGRIALATAVAGVGGGVGCGRGGYGWDGTGGLLEVFLHEVVLPVGQQLVEDRQVYLVGVGAVDATDLLEEPRELLFVLLCE